jgi:3-oxoacyl-[acyl-carrier protein] reductase
MWFAEGGRVRTLGARLNSEWRRTRLGKDRWSHGSPARRPWSPALDRPRDRPGARLEGAAVAVAGRRQPLLAAPRIEAHDGRALPLQADVRDPASVQALVESTERHLGAIDILINNAATFVSGEVSELDPAAWNDVLATNLTGAFLVTRAALPGMIRRKRGGSIVFISSTAGKRGDARGAAYCASKFGMMGLAHSLLYEVRRHAIRVVVVSPSAIDTGREAPDPDIVTGARPHASDVAASVIHCLGLPQRALVREVEIWGTNP